MLIFLKIYCKAGISFSLTAAIQLHILTLEPSIQSSASIYPDQRCMGETIPAVQAPWTCLSQGSIETTLTDVVIVTLLTGRQASGKAVYQNTRTLLYSSFQICGLFTTYSKASRMGSLL